MRKTKKRKKRPKKKRKVAEEEPERVPSTREIRRRIERRKRRKKILTLLAITLILVSIIMLAAYLTAELRSLPPVPTQGTLVIHVVDEHTNNPIDGATISIAGPHDATGQSNEQGTYSFESIPKGTYTVTVTKSGYHTHPEIAIVKAGETTHHTAGLHTQH